MKVGGCHRLDRGLEDSGLGASAARKCRLFDAPRASNIEFSVLYKILVSCGLTRNSETLIFTFFQCVFSWCA